ncbi:MAG: cupredoxin domain-containing protein [Candidatus Daviesbacteria bacterium]|nr:cupredoxin domain-containing protein [Candidatus Daviesbacteria bacterium]
MMSKSLLAGLFVLLLLLIGGFLAYRSYNQPLKTQNNPLPSLQPTITPLPQVASPSATATDSAQIKNLVTITSAGFSPKVITIKIGETVTWINEDKIVHTVDSALHPTHLVYPRLNLGNIDPGAQNFLSFPEVGTYSYHDHLNAKLTGQVVVK